MTTAPGRLNTQKLTDQQTDTMRQWHKAGQTYQQLSWFFKVSVNAVRYQCDDTLRERKLAEKRNGIRRADVFGVGRMPPASERRKIDRDAMNLKRKIPKDTREITGVLLGDPLFERSALYEKQRGSNL
ncbi:MAG: hypothetical protein GY807_20995 [Gammaproteobacteria bacterium]|nr:hypothetical protein [Gammaproteobacteria bacterium]